MMKKQILLFLIASSCITGAASLESKRNITFGGTVLEHEDDGNNKFGGLYTVADFAVSDESITAGGKIYYRLNSSEQLDDNAQKIEIKRAFLRARPFKNDTLEFSIGKLYSYYLTGGYFFLSEIYTACSRWGKTGVGVKTQFNNLEVGLALPVSETYEKFGDTFSINAEASYDLKKQFDNLPLKIGATLFFTDNQKEDEITFASTASILFTPKGHSFFLAASFNSEPYVASTVFKNVSNCKEPSLKKSNFASLNARSSIGLVGIIVEAEGGKATESSYIPLYAGTQLRFPITEVFSFRPRFYYYAALNADDSDKGRSTYEINPRIYATLKNFIIYAGWDFIYRQETKDDWSKTWKIPFYIELKM